MKSFSEKDTIKKIDEYMAVNYYKNSNNSSKKVFYNSKQLCGWRFYLKALRHWDWASIKSYIKQR